MGGMKVCAWCSSSYTKPRRSDLEISRYCSRRCAAYGRVVGKPKRYLNPDSFWNKVRIGEADECWEWQASRNKHGYGQVAGPTGSPMHAHKVAYALVNGPVCVGMYVCHHCDNKPCCNPRHLYAGTPKENRRDATVRGRWMIRNPARGAKHGSAKLTEEDVRAIRQVGGTAIQVAAAYGVSPDCIRLIRRHKTWAWLEDAA